jgi:hypothetical protein
MFQKPFSSRRVRVASAAACGVGLAALGGIALAQQDKYALQVPGGLAFSSFRGYEGWQVVSTSQNDRAVAVIVANPVMIEAYKAGIPGNGKPFPDGAKMAKVHWRAKQSAEAPAPTSTASSRAGSATTCPRKPRGPSPRRCSTSSGSEPSIGRSHLHTTQSA